MRKWRRCSVVRVMTHEGRKRDEEGAAALVRGGVGADQGVKDVIDGEVADVRVEVSARLAVGAGESAALIHHGRHALQLAAADRSLDIGQAVVEADFLVGFEHHLV